MRLIDPAPLTFERLDETYPKRPSVHLRGAHGEKVIISVMDRDMFRVQMLPDGDVYRNPRTWAVIGEDTEMPLEGKRRDAIKPFHDPKFPDIAEVDIAPSRIYMGTLELKLLIDLEHFALRWFGEKRMEIAADLDRGAYVYDGDGRAIHHYMKRDLRERYLGFGEVAGPLDKAGMRIRMNPVDALGYNAETSDPLYKHFPYYITLNGENQTYGLFYDNTSLVTFDMGKEIDYTKRARYRYYRAEYGDLDYYFLYGGLPPPIGKLIGKPALPPKWTLGYLGSTMSYTEAADAQAQLSKFAALCEEHDIPCDCFHLSSGYTTDSDGRRMVFTWNRERIPDPNGMIEGFHNAGMRVAANVKPHLLKAHPMYDEVAAQGGFIKQADNGLPAISQFWSGGAGTTEQGSLIDFTSVAGFNWWKSKIKASLLDYGVDAIWNDNNEFEIDDYGAMCDGFGEPINVGQVRPTQTLLMARASYEALREQHPDQRPYLITRSASVGTQRYAQTWSGDNETSWHSLKWNIPMGLGMSLSGMPNIGHDVGGFYGEKPDPELFVRWVQCGIFHPRFCIHSWHTDGSVNEPWMYPEMLPYIREAIQLRYRLIPYLYTLLVRSQDYYHAGEPIIAPVMYEDDQIASFDFMLGDDLLIAPIYEPGIKTRKVYLPNAKQGWFDFYTGEWYEGGQTIEVDVTLDRIPVFARDGAIIPIGKVMRYVGEQPDDLRQMFVFTRNNRGWGRVHEDDGVTFGSDKTDFREITVSVDHELSISVQQQGTYALPYKALEFVFPPGEQREIKNGEEIEPLDVWGKSRRRVRVPL